MKTSESGIDFIKKWEGFSPIPYLCPAGKSTIGYGHVIRANETIPTLTEAQADILLRGDLLYRESAVNTCVQAPINQNQFDALVSFAYNLGGAALMESTLLRFLNSMKYQDAADQFLVWDKAHINGKLVIVDGLKARREAERVLFLT